MNGYKNNFEYLLIFPNMTQILTITGSDNSGWSGLQLDLRIITEMGGHALTAATCIVMQNEREIKGAVNFPKEIICEQIKNIISDFHPKAVKVGLARTPEAVRCIAEEIVGCKNIVVAPGIMSSNGILLVDDETVGAFKQYLFPMASLLVLRQKEAEKLLGIKIATDDDMLNAAKQLLDFGAEYVMLRGGQIVEGRITALLASRSGHQFFSSYNIEGWQQHGVGGALSTAIATCLGTGKDVTSAIKTAHDYVHSKIVYSVKSNNRKLRPADIYNEFMNLLSDNYQSAHDVAFYADKLNITARYLSQITNETISKAPKQIINEYLVHEAEKMLDNSRLSVKEVSDGLGFSSVAMFCKCFKQQKGVSPSEYRQSVN